MFEPELTFAIGDIHGRLDLLEKAIIAVQNYAGNRPARLISLGDLVDRGPMSAQVVKRFRAGPLLDNWEWVVLFGNHEEFMIHHSEISAARTWLHHGGYETLLSYGIDPDDESTWDQFFPYFQADCEWMKTLPHSFEDEHRFFAHAGVNPYMELHFQSSYDFIWSRDYAKTDRPWVHGKYVVHGHTPLKEGASIGDYKANLDSKAFKTGNLTVAVFENDKPGRPVGVMVIEGPDIKTYRTMSVDEDKYATLKKWLKSKGLR